MRNAAIGLLYGAIADGIPKARKDGKRTLSPSYAIAKRRRPLTS
jgi:hypothetical protein